MSALTCLIGLALLFFGGELLVRGASGLALRSGLSRLAIGLTVVAFGTSMPELLVSIDAAMSGANDISVGNVVGSNIANIALILGLAALLKPMLVESKVIGVDLPIMVLVSLLLMVVLSEGLVTRMEGAFLSLGLVFYVWLTFRLARPSQSPGSSMASAAPVQKVRVLRLSLLIVAGLVLMFGGARLLVVSAIQLAAQLRLSEAAIGLTIVAVGTSLPELATTIVASLRREGDIAIGNVVGSNTFNVLGVLGLTAVVHPVELGEITRIDLGLMALLALLLGALLLHRLYLNRLHGALFVLIFVVYAAWRLS